MKHPGHMYGGFIPAISERGMTGTYCYMRMLEGLKIVGPVFCRMMKATLKDQIHINIFRYVDDIVVASEKNSTQIDDLAETFTNMCGAQLKLNPKSVCLACRKEMF
jgi:hypothetical protein